MDATTVTIELPTRLYTRLRVLASDQGTDVVHLLDQLVSAAGEGQVQPSTRAFQRILERATDLGVIDLSEQHDHYLYGVEKR